MMKQLSSILLVLSLLLFCSCPTGVDENISTTKAPPSSAAIPEQPPVPQEPDSVLEVVDVEVLGESVLISGKTDLPDGATVSVGFDVFGRSGSDLHVGVSEKSTVSNGAFQATLAIPQREEFVNGPYEATVLFTPRRQSEEVLEVVGNDGEKLKGVQVEKSGNFRVMRFSKNIETTLTITFPAYLFQKTTDFPKNSAERAVAEYVTAWRDQDWEKMSLHSQKTWVANDQDPKGMLEVWYDFKTLKGFEIVGNRKTNENVVDVTFIVHYEAFTNKLDKKQITARVIRESSPYTVSSSGTWGVNPTSAIDEKDVE